MEKSNIKEQEPSMRAVKKWFLRFLLGSLLIVSILFGIGIAILVFFTTARPTTWLGALSVGVMLTFAALAQVIVTRGAAWFIAGKLNLPNRQSFTRVFTGGVMVMMVILVNFFLGQPINVPRSIPPPRADTRYWDLSTGSRLAHDWLIHILWLKARPVLHRSSFCTVGQGPRFGVLTMRFIDN